MTGLEHEYQPAGWHTVHTLNVPGRKGEYFPIDDLRLSLPARQFVTAAFPGGIYRHQREAIAHLLGGRHVCVTTGTASGKSLAFYVSAVEHLSRDSRAKIIAVYPTKALGVEQEERWRQALRRTGLDARVGRIDGQVPVSSRLQVMRNSSVLLFTPDVIHAWLLSRLSERAVLGFLRQISLIVVDEVHNYTGVFGSNSGYLFRRLQHVLGLLGRSPQFLCASATVAEPTKHLRRLFGLDFAVVGAEADTSPKHQVRVQLLNPPGSADLLSEVSDLLSGIAHETHSRFIAFVDSRKQTEHIASILARQQDKGEEQETAFRQDHLQRLDVLPFRAGYEEQDRDVIQTRLSRGHLRGVVSTSALELGMDIPGLDIAVLVGVPRSATSLYQRIGRIGRHAPGRVLVINTGSVYDEAVFRVPQEFMDRPLAEGALYLENIRIQYIHALCLARSGGEHDQVSAALGREEGEAFGSGVEFPAGFPDLCARERRGEVPADLQGMKAESGEDPHHTFPLRDVESQFKVEFKSGPDQRQLGSLSYGQLMREAYPGAIYYYTGRPFRVYRVNVHTKVAHVRREKNYSTKPQMLPTLVFPNLTPDNVFKSSSCGELLAVECNLQVRESICGFKERRGSGESVVQYPVAADGIYLNQPRFTRNYFTSGVVLTHPALGGDGIDCELLAGMLYEAFLMLVAFERRDINVAVDKHRVTRGPVREGDKFIALYDQTYGSLRLSGRILEADGLRRTLEVAAELLAAEEPTEVVEATAVALTALTSCLVGEAVEVTFATEQLAADSSTYETVILPGSRGINTSRTNEEFEVEAVFFSPLIQGLSYRGRHISTMGETVTETLPIHALTPIPGESRTGQYNYATGEIEEFNMM